MPQPLPWGRYREPLPDTLSALQIHHGSLARAAEEFGLAFIALFGSAAAGRMTPQSDVDIAVWAESLPWDDEARARWRIDLESAITRAIPHIDDVDVVVLNRAGSLVQFQVARHGIVLHERVPASWIRFVSYAARRYDDDAPLRLRQWAFLRRVYEL